MTVKKSSKSWAQNLIRLVSSLKNYSSKVCLHYLFWIQKLKSYNSDYRCYAKNMSNYKNIAKPSKKIGVNFWPLPEHKMTQTALWPTYLKLLPQCSKIQSIGKRSQSQIRIPNLKCHTIRKVKFLSKKFNFDKTLKFFLGNQSWIFGQKNEDFEQCVILFRKWILIFLLNQLQVSLVYLSLPRLRRSIRPNCKNSPTSPMAPVLTKTF